jgi:glutamyl-tRNA synthetase
MAQNVRVRFAPSPTGPLHIGGVRTALFNYLFAKKHKGSFILRIEDTDQKRFVAGAEDYINEALEWLGITPDEGVKQGGDYGPYKQSQRKDLYKKFADQMIASGHAYYAFDTPQQLDAVRAANEHFKYSAATRMQMNNSLTQPQSVVDQHLASGDYVIRIKLPAGQQVSFNDEIRGVVHYNTDDMDDKVLYKGSESLPTYHLANVVDDYHMKISHVIRGEEWLPSTPLHVLLYEYLGWADAMPVFVHLPLLMKPEGKGKLSKRDGAKFNMPVFPLDFQPEEGDFIPGFREWGFEAEAVLNFLALLGWNSGTDQEIFSLEELVEAFDLSRVSKSGARFDFDKAKWFNQQYIIKMSDEDFAKKALPFIQAANFEETCDEHYLSTVAPLMKERLELLKDLPTQGHYFFKVPDYEETRAKEWKNLKKKVVKKWSEERKALFEGLLSDYNNLTDFNAATTEELTKTFMEKNELGFGDVLPVLRFGLSGTMQGPGVYEMMEVLGKEYVIDRMKQFFGFCDSLLIDN